MRDRTRTWRDYFVHLEELDLESRVLLKYSLAVNNPFNDDVRQAAVQIARVLTERTHARFEELPAAEDGVAVLSVGKQDRWTDAVIAVPSRYWHPDDGLASLLELAISAAEYDYVKGIWLSNIEMPKTYLAMLPGPAIGVSTLREILGIPRGPILAVSMGALSPGVAESVRHSIVGALCGGISIMTQDMRMPRGDWDSKRSQMLHLLSLRDEAIRLSGCRKLAFMSVGGSSEAIFRDATHFLELGGDGIVINAVTSGFGMLESLRANFPKLFIVTTNMGSGLWSRPISDETTYRAGMDEVVISKFSRWAGADAVHAGTAATDCYDAEWGLSISALSARIRLPLAGCDEHRCVKRVWRVAEGNLRRVAIWKNLQILGEDSILVVPGVQFLSGSARSIAESWHRLAVSLSGIESHAEAIRIYDTIAKKCPSLRAEMDKEPV